MTLGLTFDLLNRLWSHAPHSLIEGVVSTSCAVFKKYGLTTKAEICDFMAQVSEETGGGTEIEENLNYTAQRLCQVWPSRFRSLSHAGPFAHNPRMLADNVYGGRMGNRPDTDDGWNFRGRGAIEITGRDMYQKVGAQMGVDLIKQPDDITDPLHFLEGGAAFWRMNGLNVYSDREDFRGETLRINGGLTGLDARQQWRRRWQQEEDLLDIGVSIPDATPSTSTSTAAVKPDVAPFPMSVSVWTVEEIQRALRSLGFPIRLDGLYGPEMRQAVTNFQKHAGIAVDGIVGPETRNALSKEMIKLG